MRESASKYASLIVRLWRDSESDWEWLAQIEHIPSSETRYFGSLREMFLYIEQEVVDNPPPRDAVNSP